MQNWLNIVYLLSTTYMKTNRKCDFQFSKNILSRLSEVPKSLLLSNLAEKGQSRSNIRAFSEHCRKTQGK